MSVAVLVNMHARKGGEGIGRTIRALMPWARVAVTRSLSEARNWILDELAPNPPSLLLSGGGDGTAVALLNEMRACGLAFPAFGLLPLGTGNGWARGTGTPWTYNALEQIAAFKGALPPIRSFRLLETEGRLAPFAGTGWDAEIVNDYQEQLADLHPSLRRVGGGFPGYLRSIFTRTIPRHLFSSSPTTVTLRNLGAPALAIDENGVVTPVPDGGPGAVLYQGPVSVAGAGTTTELGLGFRAFPFAHAVPGTMAVRVYGATPVEATIRMRELWRGAHPLPKSHHWLLTHCHMQFDREIPFEVGGDIAGKRTGVEFRLSEQEVSLVDWARMGKAREKK